MRRLPARLRSRDSNSAKGKAKWKRIMMSATTPHPPRMRFKYQLISSGRLPAQMINHCENEK